MTFHKRLPECLPLEIKKYLEGNPLINYETAFFLPYSYPLKLNETDMYLLLKINRKSGRVFSPIFFNIAVINENVQIIGARVADMYEYGKDDERIKDASGYSGINSFINKHDWDRTLEDRTLNIDICTHNDQKVKDAVLVRHQLILSMSMYIPSDLVRLITCMHLWK